MQEVEGLVSIVIPAYNAADYIGETVASVKRQTYTSWEIIVVNDGSSDETGKIIEDVCDDRIKLFEQENAGVSAARNKGLQLARGEFIIFLDADDLFTPLFLETRIEALRKDGEISFVGGLVEYFPGKTLIKQAVTDEAEKKILFFEKDFVTIPSNYMYRRQVLQYNNISFNPLLSSTADRFFLLEVSKHSRGKSVEGREGRLLYRVSPGSMSNKLTVKLMKDNEEFYRQLKAKKMLPLEKEKVFTGLFFFSLALGYIKLKKYKLGANWFLRSFLSAPLFFINSMFRKIKGQALVA